MIVRQLVAQGDPAGTSLANAISDAFDDLEIDRLDVAVAYATKPGLAALRSALGEWPAVTRWVIGLDDAITQPAAIDELIALPNAEVRLASFSAEGRRFHPKVYCFWSSENPAVGLAIIGSANMTEHGLRFNGEAAILIEAETEADANQLKNNWEIFNTFGEGVDAFDLEGYRLAHNRARKARRRIRIEGIAPSLTEAEEGLSVTAQIIEGAPNWWLEIGSAVGGRELELPKAVLPFFDLPAGASEILRSFILPDGREVKLRLIDRAANDMWRIEFTADSIGALSGRPSFRRLDGTARSDLALHLQREGNVYRARTVVIDAPQYQALVTQSQANGVLDSTPGVGGRAYGFF